jgi:iron(III) transport system permease protein
MILIEGFIPEGDLTVLDSFRELFSGYNLEILWNSVTLSVAVVVIATLMAFPLAYFMTKTSLSKHLWLDILIMIPFMTPPYISSMGWMLAMQPNGILEQIHPIFSNITPYFFSFWGMALIMACNLTPFLYSILKNTIMNLQKSQEEASLLYGGGVFYRLRKIFTPMFISGYSMGALLVFVRSLGEFGTPVTMGYRIGYYVLTSEIHRASTVWPINFQRAALLSVLLLGASMFAWGLQQWIESRFSYSSNRGKGSQVRKHAKGSKDIIYWVIIIVILFILVFLPYAGVFTNSVLINLGDGFTIGNLTLQNFVDVLSGNGGIAMLNSVVLALISATIASTLGLWFVLTTDKSGKINSVINFSSLLPNTVPGIIVIVGLILFWNNINNPLPFYNTPVILIITYVCLYIPFSVQNIKSVRSNISSNLIEAAKISGGSNWDTFKNIIFPLLLPGIISGWILIFSISVRELVGSLMLRPTNMHTSATYIYNQFQQGNSIYGMALAVVSIGISTTLLVLLEIYNRQKAKA